MTWLFTASSVRDFPETVGQFRIVNFFPPLIFSSYWVIDIRPATYFIISALYHSLFSSHSLRFGHFLQHLRHLQYLITLFIHIPISIKVQVFCETTLENVFFAICCIANGPVSIRLWVGSWSIIVWEGARLLSCLRKLWNKENDMLFRVWTVIIW